MASPSASSAQLAIAKASLTSALFRKDPVACDRSEIDAFHSLLAAAVQRCSPPNVQACKHWIVKHIVPSANRAAALGRFLSAFIDGLVDPPTAPEPGPVQKPKPKPKPRARRKRLHVLYVLNDVLHHVATHANGTDFVAALEASLSPIFAGAAQVEQSVKHDAKLRELLGIWESRQYIPASVVHKLRSAVELAASGSTAQSSTLNAKKQSSSTPAAKETPFVLPSIHGDPATPWYDLPASTWLHQLVRSSTKPMNPNNIKPLHMSAGAPDAALADAVRDLLRDVDQIYAKDCTAPAALDHCDLNELGELVVLDEVTGEVLGGDTYYGWSRGFCEKMKKHRGSARERGRSLSSGAGSMKSRIHSQSHHNRSRSRSHGRRDGTRSHSRSRSRSRSASYSRSRSRSRSLSRSRSRSPHRPASKRPRLSPSRSPSRGRGRNPYRGTDRLSPSALRSVSFHGDGQDRSHEGRSSFPPYFAASSTGSTLPIPPPHPAAAAAVAAAAAGGASTSGFPQNLMVPPPLGMGIPPLPFQLGQFPPPGYPKGMPWPPPPPPPPSVLMNMSSSERPGWVPPPIAPPMASQEATTQVQAQGSLGQNQSQFPGQNHSHNQSQSQSQSQSQGHSQGQSQSQRGRGYHGGGWNNNNTRGNRGGYGRDRGDNYTRGGGWNNQR